MVEQEHEHESSSEMPETHNDRCARLLTHRQVSQCVEIASIDGLEHVDDRGRKGDKRAHDRPRGLPLTKVARLVQHRTLVSQSNLHRSRSSHKRGWDRARCELFRRLLFLLMMLLALRHVGCLLIGHCECGERTPADAPL